MRRLRRWILLIIAGLSVFAFIHFFGYTLFTGTTGKEKTLMFDKLKFKRPVVQELESQNSYGLFKLQGQKFSCPAPLTKTSIDIDTKVMWETLMGGVTPARESEGWNEFNYNKEKIITDPKLLVFVVPHSHVDPGWLRTVDEYSQSTSKILTNMLNYLPAHPNMTFTWMEISFFSRWWESLKTEDKEKVKKFISDGQFELTSGSWVMTDEASPYFWATIDNIIEGHQFLKENFGFVPKVAWSNDPFGYGSTVPYLFRLANISYSVIHRIHTAIKIELGKKRNMDFYFRQYWDKSLASEMFTHVLPYSHYDIPNTCGPNPGICCQFDFKRLTHFSCGGPSPVEITEKNVKEKSEIITNQYRLLAEMYKNNVILVMLGDDFRYDEMQEWSQQHDNYARLFEYINSQPSFNMEIQFATFSKFFEAVRTRSKNNYITLSGDFFPYHDVSDHYWTGYYTTRPFFKRMDRLVQAMIRAADISSTMAVLLEKRNSDWFSNVFSQLQAARRNLALFQHHDAITGTSKWKVVDDYGQRLHSALLIAANVTAQSVSSLINAQEMVLDWAEFMPGFKALIETKVISVDDESASVLWVYNSLPFSRFEIVTIHINRVDIVVKNFDGTPTVAQLNPIVLSSGEMAKDRYELLIKVHLPPLAAVQLVVQRSNAKDDSVTPATIETSKGRVVSLHDGFKIEKLPNLITLTNNKFKTYHSSKTGYLKYIQTKTVNYSSHLEFLQYVDTSSGAYLFSPHKPAKPWDHNVTTVFVIKGPLKEEVVSITEGILHRESVLNSIFDDDKVSVQIENIVDVRNDKNTEVVMRLYTNVMNDNYTFFTDANGFQLLERNYLQNQNVERNYYPVASTIMMQDDKTRYSILTGQPHGATCPDLGVFEIMLDRILVQDDSKGLGYDSIIRDNVPAKSNFRILVEPEIAKNVLATPTFYAHQSFQKLLYKPIVFRQRDSSKFNDFYPLKANFSCDIELLNLRSFNAKQFGLILRRLHGSCQQNQMKVPWCSAADDGVHELLDLLKIKNKLKSCTLSGIIDNGAASVKVNDLQPMEIKTFCF